MYKLLIIMKNHSNGITSEVVEFDSADLARTIAARLRQTIQTSYDSSIREVVELY